jgi:hypothetical protein
MRATVPGGGGMRWDRGGRLCEYHIEHAEFISWNVPADKRRAGRR